MTGAPNATKHADTEAATAATAEASCAPIVDPTARPPRPSKRVSERDPNRVRLCVVKRTEQLPADLIRFVLGPDDRLVPDLSRRLPGRGVWVTATRQAVAEALKRGLFAKSLKHAVKTDKDLVDQVEKLLAVDARQALSLANKAGFVTTGFAKVEIAIEKGAVAALVAAQDASSDGTGKLARKFKAIRGASGLDAPVINDFTSAELDLAFGGSNVIHAAIAGGGLGRRVLSCCQRLRRYRMTMDELDASRSDLVSPVESSGAGVADASARAGAALGSTPHGAPDAPEQNSAVGAGRSGAQDQSSDDQFNSDQAGTDHA